MNKKFTKLIAAVALLVFMTPALVGWGQTRTETTTTCTFSTKAWAANNGGTWTSGKDGNQFTSGRGVQVTIGATGANGTSGDSFENVSKIVVTYSTNASKGKGAIKIQVGSGTEQSYSIASAVGTDDYTHQFDFSPTETGKVKITVDCTENSIYIKSVAITTTSGSTTYTVTYDGNGATSGTAPTDATAYSSGATVTVLGNTGSLEKTGYTFGGWNTQADGQGTNYTAGNTFSITANTTLYAKWTDNRIETIVDIDDSGITNTNKYFDTDAGSFAATVYDDNVDEIVGATVTWNSSDESVATIDASTGAVTLVNAGTTTITASYAGDDAYQPSSETYELTVTNVNPYLTTIWSEDFSSYSADDVPSGGDFGYNCTGSGTKIYEDTYAGGTSPELLVAKSGGAFTATIPLLTSTYCYSGDLTLTFRTNNTNIAVSTTTSGVTISGTIVSGANTITLSGVTETTESVVIAFTNSNSSNVRLDNIVLKGVQAALTKVATPVISPASGAVASGTEVTITCATDGASIYYTTDGSDPTSSSTAYNPSTKPTIAAATTLKAIAVKDGLTDSDVASATYTIATPCATPTFSVLAGEVEKGTTVTISTETDGATIYYTTDGTDPTTSSSTYSSAITINTAMTIKAFAAKDGMANSEIASVSYTVIDYTTLPFIWAGGTKDALAAVTGVTTSGLGSDYAESNAPYRVKMDGVGDYIQVKTDVQPVKVTIGVKMLGGATTSKIKVQESSNGSDFTDVDELTISGSSNAVLNLETTTTFASTTRYVKIIKSVHGSNIGVGPITIYTTTTIPVNATTHEIESDVTVADGYVATITSQTIIPSGKTLTVNGRIVNNTTSNLVIKDGGQLKTANGVACQVEKNITGYGTSTSGNYYLIAPPYTIGSGDFLDGGTLAQADIDLYFFNEGADKEWINFKQNGWQTAVVRAKGYLYARKADGVLLMGRSTSDTCQPTNTTVNVNLDYTTGKRLAGYNLIGNPFTCTAYLADGRDFLRMNDAGNGFISGTGAINVGEGVFVEATTSGTSVTFTTTAPDSSVGPDNSMITLNLTQNRGAVIDNARIRFDNGNNITKFMLNEASTKLYIPQGGKDYAVVRSEAQGEMPVNFKADRNGSYTLSIDIDADMDYLHLIDNMTGADVDLLQTPSYTFDARTSDYASRFRLVFSANDENGASTGSATFAYFNGSEWVVNSNGNATLQVVDVMGRVLSSETVNGNHTMNLNLSTGVYMLRLVNGNDVKTQKIVVR